MPKTQLSCFKLSRAPLPGWIGIVAILMLFIAPVVSRYLEHAQVPALSHGMLISDMGDMPMMQPQHSGHIYGADIYSPKDMMDDIACGYCLMLLHAPILEPSIGPGLYFVAFIISRRAFPQTHIMFVMQPVLKDMQPRAPPSYKYKK